MGKPRIDFLKGIEEEEAFLNLLRQGKSRKEAYEAIGREKTWASKTIKKIRKTEPERLKGTAEEIKDKAPAEQAEAEPPAQGTPQTAQKPQTAPEPSKPNKSTFEEEKTVYGANTKPQKAVMGFRAEVDKIELWKIYADAAEQEIGTLCTAAIDEYIRNHELTADQKEIFDIKKQALEAEKRIKNRKRNIVNS